MKHDVDFYLESVQYDEGLKDKFKSAFASLISKFDKNENIFIRKGKQYLKSIAGSEQEELFLNTVNSLIDRLKKKGYSFSKNTITPQDLLIVASTPINEEQFKKKAHRDVTKFHLMRRLIDDIRLPFVFVPILGMWQEITALAKGTGGSYSALFAQLIFGLVLILANFIIEHKRFKKDDPEQYEKEREERAETLRSKKTSKPGDFQLRDPEEGEFE